MFWADSRCFGPTVGVLEPTVGAFEQKSTFECIKLQLIMPPVEKKIIMDRASTDYPYGGKSHFKCIP